MKKENLEKQLGIIFPVVSSAVYKSAFTKRKVYCEKKEINKLDHKRKLEN